MSGPPSKRALAGRPGRSCAAAPALALALALALAACGSGDGSPGASSTIAAGETGLAAFPANFDVAVASPQAFLLGLVGPEQESVAYGKVQLAFSYIGPTGKPLPRPRPGPKSPASFVPVAGTKLDPSTPGPRLVTPSVARGVYRTEPLSFPDAGVWEVAATADLTPKPARATAAFVVLARHQVPAVGDPAPRTDNPVTGDPSVPARAIDSRAQGDTPIPDPELHATSAAAALDRRRPLTVVISTPTYCQSRFCGPITDTVGGLAARYGDRMDFVHLEVWADFEKKRVNPAAAAWILQGEAGGNEPWVFVVDANGVIAERFDNVANADALEAAIQRVLTGETG